jgi:EAL domain-containing protein (putative c-di-GMP-specific phosphodiesterase class I)
MRVLIIDDHAMVADSLVRLLSEDPEIEVIAAVRTATAGLERAQLEQPDIVLMDFVLPDMDGATATRMLQSACPSIRVIMLTGADWQSTYEPSIEAGACAWISKTRSVQDLRATLHRVYGGLSETEDQNPIEPTAEQLVVHYQPAVNLSTDAIVGFEAFVRWQHPQRGLLPPSHFLARAEETGFIDILGRHVGQAACLQLARWQQWLAAGRNLWMSVNVSSCRLRDDAFVDEVAQFLAPGAIRPRDLVLDVTEAILEGDAWAAGMQLQRLKDLGVRIALDESGIGDATLRWLRMFPFDVVKIDRSLTARLPRSKSAMRLAESIQELTSVLGIRGIAEGVERPAQAKALRELGWDWAQGFLYSPPVGPDAAAQLLNLEGRAYATPVRSAVLS